MNHSRLYTEHKVRRLWGRPGLAAFTDAVVLLFVLKNAGGSVYSQTFGPPDQALAVVLWYGLAGCHVAASGLPSWLLAVTRVCCAATSLAAWIFLPGQVIPAHDWAVLTACSYCSAKVNALLRL